MKIAGSTYQDIYDGFAWDLPDRFNVADACCYRHVRDGRGDDPALIYVRGDGAVQTYTFGHLAAYANRFANVLRHLGVGRGQIVAVHLPQTPEALIAHLGIQAIGAIALPLFALFGPDAMQFRLADSRSNVLVTSAAGLERMEGATLDHPTLEHVLSIDGPGGQDVLGFWSLMENASPDAIPADTKIDDPAFLMYTSGTTGNPKGVLHAQRVLIGHLPGIILPHCFFPQPADRFWTPADWAWAGGLFDALLPSLYFGVAIVGQQMGKFDPEAAFQFMEHHSVRNAFIPPTALRLMRKVPDPGRRFKHDVRSIGTGGESLGEDMIAWGRDAFGLTLNEFYGQTEVNLVIGNCSDVFPVRPGSMGRAIPGHEVAVIGSDGDPVPDGEDGIVAVKRPNPVMFLEYWRNPDATEAKFVGDWCLLGDVARRDSDGYFWFRGRDDDIIISAGYRIGPSEVEDCLARHPAVLMAGVIGAPDKTRGEVVVAFVVLRPSYDGSDALILEIQDHVRSYLGAHEYPRRIRILPELPMTLTGKIRRKDLRALEANYDT